MNYKRVPLENFNPITSFDAMIKMQFFVDRDKAPFNNDATDFDATNAWWMIDHSRLAYVPDKKYVRKVLKEAGYSDVKFIWNNETGTKVYVTWNDERVIVSFTGTELKNGPDDVLTDLDFLPTESGQGGVVHEGFKRAFDSVWKELETLLEDFNDKSIWITGHSLGGALAVHAASRLMADGCYTYGAPRVGSKSFNKSIMTPIYRVAKYNDIVTRVPTPPIYVHPKDLYFITNEEKLLKNPTWFRMLYERLGGSEIKIVWLLFKLFVLKSEMSFILSYLHGHSPYNYSVYMWNNIDN